MEDKKYLYIDTVKDCDGLLCFLTLSHRMNAISCVNPIKHYNEKIDIKQYVNYIGKDRIKNVNDFIAVDSELVDKCIETMFINGTVMSDKQVVKNTKENRIILGINNFNFGISKQERIFVHNSKNK